MDKDFNNILNSAISRCNRNLDEESYGRCDFNNIYPFTTENINGYIKEFDLENKSLLTVGSSSDQVINSAYFNCNNQTVIDICPYTKYYFYLKKAALLKLNYVEFLAFFCYRNYPVLFIDNKNTLNIEYFNQIKGLLKELNDESYQFWNELFSRFKPIDIRTKLFSLDEDRVKTLRETNKYLNNKYSFNETKNKIIDINPVFINKDISKVNIDNKFDNIWFSNIGAYHPIEYMKELIEKYEKNLNINGKMLICYLYDTMQHCDYNENWESIYNLTKTYEILGEYITDFINFFGIKGIVHDKRKIKDSILVYKKTKD